LRKPQGAVDLVNLSEVIMKTVLSKPYFLIPLILVGLLLNGALLIGGLSLLSRFFIPGPDAEVSDFEESALKIRPILKDSPAVQDNPAVQENPAVQDNVPTQQLTGQQANAVRSAKQYLSMSGFSRDGLIEQLSSDFGDGYSIADATSAVDNLNIDWNQEAVRSAKQYLEMQGFSCDGLIEQLSSSAGGKFTVSQATYGARQAGACN
jgi:hypothetical protein